MNFLFVNFCLSLIVLNGFSLEFVDDIALTAITDIPYLYLHQLYSKEVNQDPPTQWEERMNLELTHRLRICKEITETGVFRFYGKLFVDMVADQEQLRDELKNTPQYEEIYRDLFTDGELTNRFRPRRFDMSAANIYPRQPNAHLREVFVEDHVFTCLLRREFSDHELIPIYVTKLYQADRKLHAHRFLLEERNGYLGIMLAEAPAQVYAPPDFSIETHYLQLKRNNHPESNSKIAPDCLSDPVCRLSNTDQHFRLCVIVLSSSYFRGRGITEVRRLNEWLHRVGKFSFRTEKGRKVMDESPYSELLVPCEVRMTDDREDTFYLSRAYTDNQVLVSVQDPRNGKFYLESLSINIGILNERT